VHLFGAARSQDAGILRAIFVGQRELALSYTIALQLAGEENGRQVLQLRETLEEQLHSPGVKATQAIPRNSVHPAIADVQRTGRPTCR
jgi:hypothetical protein